MTRPATDGSYSVKGLPPGEYYLAAPTDLETGEWNDPVLLEQFVRSSAKITLRDGETTTQDFRLGGHLDRAAAKRPVARLLAVRIGERAGRGHSLHGGKFWSFQHWNASKNPGLLNVPGHPAAGMWSLWTAS
jgi:hypothetical protein